MVTRSRLSAVLHLRCPVCLEGPMFARLFTMHHACPACGHVFEREVGYFRGAMYVSYAIGVVLLYLVSAIAITLFGDAIGFLPAFAVAAGVHLALVPLLFRYSRAVWAHLNIATAPRT